MGHGPKVAAMDRIVPVAGFQNPMGGQTIELQQVDFEAGGMSLLRVRIREGRRFTVFEIDPLTAGRWGQALQAWAHAQARTQDKP